MEGIRGASEAFVNVVAVCGGWRDILAWNGATRALLQHLSNCTYHSFHLVRLSLALLYIRPIDIGTRCALTRGRQPIC